MPTYTNATNADIVVGSRRFPSYSTITTDEFVEGTLPTGLTLASVDPQTNKSLLANKYTAVSAADIATISVPVSSTKGYVINFYVESGEFQVRFNEDAMSPAIRIDEGETWTQKYVTRVVTDIRIHCVTGGTIFVNIDAN